MREEWQFEGAEPMLHLMTFFRSPLFQLPTRFQETLILFRTGLIGAITFTAVACSTGPRLIGPDGKETRPDTFALVLLRTGPNPEAGTEDLFQGHFGFMGEQADSGNLLIAGPFGDIKSAPDLRGIFLFDSRDMDKARELAAGDPTTQAGVFRQEVFPLETLDVVRLLPALETEHQEERAARGDVTPGPDIRPYCIVTAVDGATASLAFQHPEVARRVVLFGRLGGERDGELFAVLDAESASMAHAVLRLGNEADAAFEVSEWASSPSLLRLSRAAR